MSARTQERVYRQLHRLPRDGLAAAKELFWTELNYERANKPLSRRNWPDRASSTLARDPVLLAEHPSRFGSFDVIYAPLASTHQGRGFPLSLTAERLAVGQLLNDHPYALFVFSDTQEQHWHLVNVRLDQVPSTAEVPGTSRRVFRRIAIGPHERLRTAAERVAMLDLSTLDPDLFGLSPLAIQQRHDEAFNVEAVTRKFFTDYRRIFEDTEKQIEGLENEELRLFTLRLFNRLLFLTFLERKGWLAFEGRSDYLHALWEAHQAEVASGATEANFYRDRLELLFFSGLNNASHLDLMRINQGGFLSERIGQVPYLNGGLFEESDLDRRAGVTVPDAVFAPIFEDLIYRYNFTVTESTPLDIEVAVDPEMLGRIFEELVTGRHETGSYYTPKPVVSFMCREALKAYLHDRCQRESMAAIAAFVDEHDAQALADPEGVLQALQEIRCCDPACGSGAYLVGMLHELVDLRQALFVTRGVDAQAVYDRKLEIIRRNLYGVDIDPFAVNIARLRLWLSLIVDFEGETPPPLPNLEFKIEVGDSLTGPAPGQLQPDLFHHQQVEEYFRLKGEFMTAHGPQKLELRQRIEELQAQIAAWASGGESDGFDWAVTFAEVFAGPGLSPATVTGAMTRGVDVHTAPLVNATAGQMQLAAQEGQPPGFDVVLTNPPYVRQELLGRELKQVLGKRYPEVYRGTADLYVYFYARALHLLRAGGAGSFISSNKWLRAGYGQKLRQHLATQTTLNMIVDFGDLPLFTATAYPLIIVFRKEPPDDDHELRALEVEDLAVVDRLAEVVAELAWPQPQASLRPDGWTLVRPQVRALLEKLRRSGTPLGEYVGGKFYRGIVTGLNKAFVIDQATRDRLVAEDPRSVEIIKPWLRGQDIKRWRIGWAELYIIFTRRGINIRHYPAVRDYLTRFKDQLMPGKGRKPGTYKWFEIQDVTAYWKEFEKPKIIWPNLCIEPRFTYDGQEYYVSAPANILPIAPDKLFLVGILNSSVVSWFMKRIAAERAGGFIEYKPIYVTQIPIPDTTPAQRAAIESLVRKLLDAKGQGSQVAEWERELNALVYELYGLTEEEIGVVEGQNH